MRLMAAAGAKALITEILVGLGASSRDADTAATHLVDANLVGDSSHGIQMLPCLAKDWLDGPLYPTSHATSLRQPIAPFVIKRGRTRSKNPRSG
jgi:LDH2 family malate/lactate/ureidoglycolate dehydrogenase